MKKILIASANSLFVEMVSEILCAVPDVEILYAQPEAAQASILANQPEVILVSEGFPKELLARLKETAQGLAKCRVIVMSLIENNYLVIQSEKATLKKIDELLLAVELQGGCLGKQK